MAGSLALNQSIWVRIPSPVPCGEERQTGEPPGCGPGVTGFESRSSHLADL